MVHYHICISGYFRSSEKSRSIPLFITYPGRFDCCLCIECFRIFFSKSYTPNPTPKKIYSQMTNPINTLIFRFHSVSSNQIREIVMAFPSDKVPGYYKVPKTSFEKNCFSAWAGTLVRTALCSDEGLTLETSAKHHIPQATNKPYQPC